MFFIITPLLFYKKRLDTDRFSIYYIGNLYIDDLHKEVQDGNRQSFGIGKYCDDDIEPAFREGHVRL